MNNWIQGFVEDPGVIHRVFYCDACCSLRYHQVKRLKITKVEKDWWIFFERTCLGLPPVIPGKWPKLIKDCRYTSREWMLHKQWHWLIKVNAYTP